MNGKWLPLLIVVTFFLGFISGFLSDKNWLVEEELAYFQQLTAENKRLKLEKDTWLTFIKEEMSNYEIILPKKDEQFIQIANILDEIDVEVKLLDQIGVLERNGILISFSNDEKKVEGMKQLILDYVPIAEQDIQQFYLSLLRIRGVE